MAHHIHRWAVERSFAYERRSANLADVCKFWCLQHKQVVLENIQSFSWKINSDSKKKLGLRMTVFHFMI